jgi:uncharacterized RDD family membrane protein YckC
MDWYYAHGDQQLGPITEDELISLAQSGKIQNETLVWREGMPDWKPFGTVRNSPLLSRKAGLQGPADVPPPAPTAFQQQWGQQSPSAAVAMDYAGFWIRLAAYILDGILLLIIGFAVGLLLAVLGVVETPDTAAGEVDVVSNLLGLLVGVAYTTFFLGRFGATPGKMALNLRVVRSDGSAISYLRAFARFWAEMLSGLLLLIGYIMVAFDREKRGLHDHICDTRVIKR